jgi:hypothetical protein
MSSRDSALGPGIHKYFSISQTTTCTNNVNGRWEKAQTATRTATNEKERENGISESLIIKSCMYESSWVNEKRGESITVRVMPQELGRLVGKVRKVVVGHERRVRTSNLTRQYK